MTQIPTAEEWLKHFEENAYPGTPISECMIEFAKLHVEAALYIASERADLTDNGRFPYVDKASILNSYSLDNIK